MAERRPVVQLRARRHHRRQHRRRRCEEHPRAHLHPRRSGKATSFGLGTAPWYYHRVVTDTKKNTYTVEETDMRRWPSPYAGDENEDGTVNWEDGAIAYRDIMNNPYKSEEVPELVAWRIAMNFAPRRRTLPSTTLDNVKKVASTPTASASPCCSRANDTRPRLRPSGLRRHQHPRRRRRGHEHPDGEGHQVRARFGVHVNASEMYPEAKAFSEDMVRRNSAGGLSYGWNWLDQGVGIDGIYDLASGMRKSRFADSRARSATTWTSSTSTCGQQHLRRRGLVGNPQDEPNDQPERLAYDHRMGRRQRV